MDDDRAATERITEAHERTRAAGSARFELLVDWTWDRPAMPKRRRGGLAQPVRSVAWGAAKRLLKAATRDFDFRHQRAEGVIDFERRRYMLDFGSYAISYADGQTWSGRSGRRRSTLPPERHALPTPLWMLDLLAGLTTATDQGGRDVRGAPCRCWAATVDIAVASKRTPGGVAVPKLGRFEELLAFPVEVCLDEHVRQLRVRFEQQTETLALWDFGVSPGTFDWGRLPTFRSPAEAAAVAKAAASVR